MTQEATERLAQAFEQHRELELVQHVHADYIRVIHVLRETAARFWSIGETRFSAAMETQAYNVEIAARRHIEAIAQRHGAPQ